MRSPCPRRRRGPTERASLAFELSARLPRECPPTVCWLPPSGGPATRTSFATRAPSPRCVPQDYDAAPGASLHEIAVLRLVNVAADERLVVIWLGDAREIAVEHHLGH